MDKQLLDILVCPVTGLSLTPATAEEIAQVNSSMREGAVSYTDGEIVSSPVDDLLITRDRVSGYRVDDGIPVMLPERRIDLSDLF